MNHLPPIRGQGRDRLIQSALTLFGQQGIDGTTLRDIVAHAGVSLGLVRTHFGSKQGLQAATNQYVLDQLEDLYAAAEISENSSLADLTDARWALENQTPGIMAYLRHAISKPEHGGELFERLFQRILTFVQRAEEKGDIRSDLDLRWSAFTILSMLLGPLMMEPYAENIVGESMYSENSLINRNRTYAQIFAHGMFSKAAVAAYES